jgi:hypothetical protein
MGCRARGTGFDALRPLGMLVRRTLETLQITAYMRQLPVVAADCQSAGTSPPPNKDVLQRRAAARQYHRTRYQSNTRTITRSSSSPTSPPFNPWRKDTSPSRVSNKVSGFKGSRATVGSFAFDRRSSPDQDTDDIPSLAVIHLTSPLALRPVPVATPIPGPTVAGPLPESEESKRKSLASRAVGVSKLGATGESVVRQLRRRSRCGEGLRAYDVLG